MCLTHVVRFPQCAVVSASDGRWRVASCTAAVPSACRADGASLDAPGVVPYHLATAAQQALMETLGDGALGDPPLWAFAGGLKGSCPDGYSFVVPRTAKENMYLQIALSVGGLQAAWLPVTGPDWNVA